MMRPTVLVPLLALLVVAVPIAIAVPVCEGGKQKSHSSGQAASATISSFSRSTSTFSITSSVSPSPTGSTGGSGNSTLQGLNFESTFIYDLDNSRISSPSITSSSGVTIDANVYIVDMENSSEEQIAQYKADGKTVICYLSAGTWEPGRGDSGDFDPVCYCGEGNAGTSEGCSSTLNKMADWNEWWFDIHSDYCKENVLAGVTNRIQAAKDKGCDGVDPDNVDSYTNDEEQKHGNTKEDQIAYLLTLAGKAHDLEMLIDLKNGGDMLEGDAGKQFAEAFDFSVIESCHFYNECDTYDAFLEQKKPQIQIEYGDFGQCPALKQGQNLLVYSEDHLDTSIITQSCGPS